MRVILTALCGVLISCLACTWSVAQNAPPRFEVFAEGGASILNNGAGQVRVACVTCTGPECPLVVTPCTGTVPVTSSFSKTARFFTGGRIRFTRHSALEASYSFSPNHLSIFQGNQTLGSGYGRLDLISFNYIHYLWARTPVQPFATVGVGANRFIGPSSATAVSYGYMSAGNGWQFAWNFGGGADVVLERHLAVRLELRDYVTGQPSFITGTSHNIVPSAGLVFRFK